MAQKTKKTVGEPQINAVENAQGFYSYSEFAGLLGTCSATIRRMVSRGELKRIVVTQRLIRIPASELARLQGEAI
jgi:excisionase family DNA binding protein